MIAKGLRIEKFRWLEINRDKLSPKLGCGLVLTQTPKFNMSTVLDKVLTSYKIKSVYADKIAQGFLQHDKIIKQFYTNALSSIELNESFRIIFNNTSLIMLIDYNKESVWFIGEVEKRLAFVNYYRDIIPNILKEFGIVLSGSYGRLLPMGWQNIFDVIDDEFVKTHTEVKTIEILSVITDARWRQPILSISISLLNLSTPEIIHEKICEVLVKNTFFN